VRSSLPDIVCIALLAGGLVLALRPNPHGEVNHILPVCVRNWINDGHDEAANLIAFSILGTFALCFERHPRRGAAVPRTLVFRLLRMRAFRMAALMALVCMIEIAQLFIPGRVSDLNDVCTGWSGIFAAWLLAVLLDARAEYRAGAVS
jgi:VanZ family protein